uniref:Rho-GAP domain-containing protein n=1 Tax=Sinocyclocheilus anshuiensis TaxID=1608454 RepID=A0A671LN27_9TELE
MRCERVLARCERRFLCVCASVSALRKLQRIEFSLASSDLSICLLFSYSHILTFLNVLCDVQQGLFRVAPSASKLKKLKASLDCGVLDFQEYSADPHAIAGALKSYLRELPEPLLTFDLYDDWIQASK